MTDPQLLSQCSSEVVSIKRCYPGVTRYLLLRHHAAKDLNAIEITSDMNVDNAGGQENSDYNGTERATMMTSMKHQVRILRNEEHTFDEVLQVRVSDVKIWAENGVVKNRCIFVPYDHVQASLSLSRERVFLELAG